jgi:hypothetical protein
MNKYPIADAVAALLPNVEWVLQNSNDLTTLRILTPNVAAPTQADVDNWIQAHN